MTTKQAQHTPGPWEVFVSSKDRKTGEALVLSITTSEKADHRWITHIEFASGLSEEDHANARLIAAAPELLDACELALQELRLVADKIQFPKETIARLETAIQKAEGRNA